MKSQTKNIVEIGFESLDLPDNVVADIMGHHGGIYGMLPREVWDENCLPTENILCYPVIRDSFKNEFQKIQDLIRPNNWEMHVDGDREDNGDIVIEHCLIVTVHPKHIPKHFSLRIAQKISATEWLVWLCFKERVYRSQQGPDNDDSDSEGLYGRYELSDSDSES